MGPDSQQRTGCGSREVDLRFQSWSGQLVAGPSLLLDVDLQFAWWDRHMRHVNRSSATKYVPTLRYLPYLLSRYYKNIGFGI